MALTDTINSIKNHVGEAYASLEEKNATIPQNKNIENLADSILSIPSGGGDISEYFGDTAIALSSGYSPITLIKKMPPFYYNGSFYRLFYQFENMESCHTTLFTKSSNSMMAMFSYCKKLKYADISGFKPTTLEECFSHAEELEEINTENLDTSNCTNMAYFVGYCKKLKKIDVSNFNTEKVTNMNYVFHQNYVLEKINAKYWKSPLVTTFYNMFYNCRAVEELDLSNLTSPRATSMQAMFDGCSKLKKIIIPNISGEVTTTIRNIFQNCSSLRHIDMRSFDFSKITTAGQSNILYYVNTACKIIVKDETAKTWITSRFPTYTNVVTIDEMNLLDLSSSNWEWKSNNGEATASVVNNRIYLTCDGTSSFGLDIQQNITLEAGKKYRLFCKNIDSSTWISINNNDNMMMNKSDSSILIEPTENIVNPKIVIWVNSGVVYNNVEWAIQLNEEI